MNNTLEKTPSSEFTLFTKDKTENYKQIWDKGDAYISKIRKENFSFIFQSTVTCLTPLILKKNGFITLMLQGEDEISAKNKIKPIFKNIPKGI